MATAIRNWLYNILEFRKEFNLIFLIDILPILSLIFCLSGMLFESLYKNEVFKYYNISKKYITFDVKRFFINYLCVILYVLIFCFSIFILDIAKISLLIKSVLFGIIIFIFNGILTIKAFEFYTKDNFGNIVDLISIKNNKIVLLLFFIILWFCLFVFIPVKSAFIFYYNNQKELNLVQSINAFLILIVNLPFFVSPFKLKNEYEVVRIKNKIYIVVSEYKDYFIVKEIKFINKKSKNVTMNKNHFCFIDISNCEIEKKEINIINS